MGEVVNVAVAFLVIIFIFRWVTTAGTLSSSSSLCALNTGDVLGFRPKNVTQEMIDAVTAVFPDIPPDNIRYDLLRTGNVEQTTNKILERGFLDAPPPQYYTVYPRQSPAPAPPPAPTPAPPQKETLISRYGLHDRLAAEPSILESEIGGKAVWEDSPEKREASLKERKARMILAARQ
ncbi:uncharacterized protein BT62DRAFT_983100 [Guyanagaster necrorhizus]|uniref:CUE domain-containing protein n=1 Tax=Guyanagaster necrorhizus TaxID=856835 RepID=A0A9P7VH14_9AGAR|nr:uncharacterized protein BT62DRAFT_983100 [Guyanagaster necrorhizus MCA 3950]KAG7440423.1 hypothetical protein BT62DRAFT_983100 [Guyanagaster necrorhizus MCA 3950]